MAQVEEFCDDICIIDKGKAVLEGTLSTIKRSYPRDLLYVETESGPLVSGGSGTASGKPLDGLLRAQPYVTEVSKKGNGFVVKLANPAMRSQLLRTLEEEDARVDSFYVIEPTLEQIFVEKAGALDPQDPVSGTAADGGNARGKSRGLFGRRAAK
jgi:ABC-2 type transport system ATP-binding protein